MARIPHPRLIPEHGTRTRYASPHRCRCDKCRKAHSQYQRQFDNTGRAYDCLHLYPNNKWYDEALSGQTRDVALYLEAISEEDADMRNIEFRFEEAP